ncbi:unnamed protein product [Tenebrio molitor]|nr:unnamed protein product [Tenebrio molitor]
MLLCPVSFIFVLNFLLYKVVQQLLLQLNIIIHHSYSLIKHNIKK